MLVCNRPIGKVLSPYVGEETERTAVGELVYPENEVTGAGGGIRIMEAVAGGEEGGNMATVALAEILLDNGNMGGTILDRLLSAALGMNLMQIAAVRAMVTPMIGSV